MHRDEATRHGVFIGGVAPGVSSDALAGALSAFGELTSDEVFVSDRGFGFAAFRSEAAKRAALEAGADGAFAGLLSELREERGSVPRAAREDGTSEAPLTAALASRATLAIQCQASHARRLARYLDRDLDLEVVAVGAPNEPPSEGRRATERVVLVAPRSVRGPPGRADRKPEAREGGPTAAPSDDRAASDALLTAVLTDEVLAMHADVYPRAYALQPGCDGVHVTLAAAAEELLTRVAALDRPTADRSTRPMNPSAVTPTNPSGRRVAVRLQTFPPSVLSSPELAGAARANPSAAALLAPRGASHLASLLSLRGNVHLIGLQPAVVGSVGDRERPAASRRTPEVREGQRTANARASRAYAKLKEATLRSAALRAALERGGGRTSPVRALDVGAAPGGWTQYLAERGAAVTAIDPADVVMPPGNQHRHLRVTAQVAWGRLAGELRAGEPSSRTVGASGPPYDVYVSDAVLHEVTSQEALLGGAVRAGLLKPGAVAVLTFKSVPGRGVGGYERAAAAEARRVARRWCGGGGEDEEATRGETWELFHLHANRQRERTFVGVLSQDAVARATAADDDPS